MRRFLVSFQIFLGFITQLRMRTCFDGAAKGALVLIDVPVSMLLELEPAEEEFTPGFRTLEPSGSVEEQKGRKLFAVRISVGDYVFIDQSPALKLTLKI